MAEKKADIRKGGKKMKQRMKGDGNKMEKTENEKKMTERKKGTKVEKEMNEGKEE